MSIGYNNIDDLNMIWTRFSRQFGLRTVYNPLVDDFVIDTPLTLYVDSVNGNDANSGFVGQPFQTIQAALNSLEGYVIKANIVISVAAGSYAGFHLGGLHFAQRTAVGGEASSLQIIGTMVTPTLAGGTASGTVTTGGTGGFTDSGQAWVVNALKGKYVSINGGFYRPITSNTATALTFADSTIISNGQTYVIADIGTVINSPIKTPATVQFPAQTTLCRIFPSNFDTAFTFDIRQLKFDGTGITTNACVTLYGAAIFISCSFLTTSGTGISSSNTVAAIPGVSSASRCYFEVTSGIAISSSSIISGFSYVRSVSGSPAGTGFSIQTLIPSNFASTFENLSTGISIASAGSGSAFFSGTPANFIGCTTAMSLTGPVFWACANSVTGSGNTNGFVLNKGARVQVGASGAIGATNEIVIDGTNNTLAAMRAASPKLLTNTYGTIIYE